MLTIPVFDRERDMSSRTARFIRWRHISAMVFFIFYGLLILLDVGAYGTISFTQRGESAAPFVIPVYLTLSFGVIFFIANLILIERVQTLQAQDFETFFTTRGAQWFTAQRAGLPIFDAAQQRTLVHGDAVIIHGDDTVLRYLPTYEPGSQTHLLSVAMRVSD